MYYGVDFYFGLDADVVMLVLVSVLMVVMMKLVVREMEESGRLVGDLVDV